MNNKAVLKTIGMYALLTLAAGLIGIGAVWGAKWVTDPRPALIHGDYHALVSEVGAGKPVMVVLKGCPHCADARAWLAKQHIAVTEVEFGTSTPVQKLLNEHAIDSTPTLITEHTLTVGFVPDLWTRVLAANGK